MCKLAFLLPVAGLLAAQDMTARFDEIAKARVATKQFMGNVLIAKGDRVLFEKLNLPTT